MPSSRFSDFRRARPALSLAVLLGAACSTGIDDGSDECPDDRCVSAVLVTPQFVILAPGDTVHLRAAVRTIGGLPTSFAWRAQGTAVSVSANGVVTAVARGQGAVLAIPTADSTRFAGASIAVVDPAVSATPTLSSFTNAATGNAVATGDVRPDSVDIGVSYLIGTAPGEGATALELRLRSAARDTVITLVPEGEAGRGARSAVRLRLGARGANGTALWPTGVYEARVLLRLGDGRVLGEERLGYITL
jgi:hypothetical protein